MNAPFRAGLTPELFRLTVEDFLLLKREGAFSAYSKSELLDGELWGVPRQPDDEPESHASSPIKLRVADYERLDRAGAFHAAGKTELVDGFVYRMSPQFRPHGFAKDELAYRLRRALESMGSSIHVATEQSVDLSPYSEPQPDIVLTGEPQGEGAIPGSSVRLIVEIAASTLAFDLGEKARIYAGAGVPEYWVVDVTGRRVLIHANPRPDGSGYDGQLNVPFGAPLHAATIEGLMVESAGVG